MISTVTTSTVTTITSITSTSTTVTAITKVAYAGSFALVTMLVLFLLLVQEELVTASDTPRFKALGRTLDAFVAPLFMAFAMIAVSIVWNQLH
jgi:hypothetical protein